MNPVPNDEKIVFTRRTVRHAHCVKVDWSDNDDSVVWTSLFYWLGGADIWQSIISGISSNCIPEGSIVYALLVPFYSGESREMRKDPLVTASRLANGWKSLARSRIRAIFSRGYLAQLSREQIPEIYQKYYGWMYGHHAFIVAREPLPEWKQELRSGRFFGWRIRMKLLERIYFVLFNHYDHGFEIIGRSISPDPLLEVARKVSRDYNLPLEVQESGNPFGDP